MKKRLFIFFLLPIVVLASAQSYYSSKLNLANFLIRMYKDSPFSGVRVVDDYETDYLISVLALEKSRYQNESTMERVASVKAATQVSRYVNGSVPNSTFIIRTRENADGGDDTEILELIQESTAGYVKDLELLTSFWVEDGSQKVFIYCTSLEQEKKKH